MVRCTLPSPSHLSQPSMRQALSSPTAQVRNRAIEQGCVWTKVTQQSTAGQTGPRQSGIKGYALHHISSQRVLKPMFSPKGSKYFTHWNTVNGFRAILRQWRISKRAPVFCFVFYKNQWKRYPLGQWFGEGFEWHRQGQPWDWRANTAAWTLRAHRAPG